MCIRDRASGGLGSEIARAFGREGAHVVAIAGRSLEAAEKLDVYKRQSFSI